MVTPGIIETMTDAGWWTDARRSTAAIVLLLGSCLVLWPDALDPYTWPKLLVAAAGLLFATLAAPSGRLPRTMVLVLVAALVVVAVAALIGPTPRASLLGRFPRYQGLPVLALYASCVWAGARLLADPDGERRRVLVTTLAWVAGLLGLVSVLGLLGLDVTPATRDGRIGAVTGSAVDQGLLATMLLALLLRPASSRREPLLLAGLAGSVVALLASGSPISLVAALVVLVAHGVAHPAVRRRRRLLAGAGGGIVAVVAALLAIPATRDRLLGSDALAERWVLWQDSWRLVRSDWLTGVGPSAYVDAVGRFHGTRWIEEAGAGTLRDSPSLWPLQAWATGGIVLLALAVAFVVLVAVAGIRRVRTGDDPLAFGALTAGVAYGLVMLTSFPTTATAVPVLLLVGLLAARPLPTDPPATSRLTRVGRPLAACAATLALVLGLSGMWSEIRLHHGLEDTARGELGPADQDFSAASFWRFGDPDVSLIGAQAFAAAATAGDDQAATLAVERARLSLLRTPDSYEAGEALAAGLLAQQRVGDAERVLDRVIRNFPSEPDPLVQRALARYAAQDSGGAVEDLDRAQRLDPDDVRPARLKAQILQRAGSLGRS